DKDVTVTGVALSGADAGNYDLSASPITALAHITTRAITVTATDKSKVVGESDPAFTYAVTAGSLVTDDSFSGTMTRVAGETISTYPITQGTLSLSANYALTFVPGTFTIGLDRPAPPTGVTYQPSGGGTLIQWSGSPGAASYQIWAGGRLLGTTGAGTLSLFVPEVFGPNAGITVDALGHSGVASDPAAGAYQAVASGKIGAVRFAYNSSKLTPATKRALRNYAKTIAAQGFTRLTVNGYASISRGGGDWDSRERLSVARAKNVRAYMATQFKGLHVSVSTRAAGYGPSKPVATNRTPSGRSKNRRVELIVK
ncbi:MAG: MBG domain-containing protein, partial [Actinomycetes bacterium]